MATVSAQFELTDQESADADCEGQGGYSDIDAGTPVTITDQTGEIVGSTTLPAGEADTVLGTCTWNMTIADVPSDRTQYKLEVATRGGVTHSRQTLIDDGWSFSLSLG